MSKPTSLQENGCTTSDFKPEMIETTHLHR